MLYQILRNHCCSIYKGMSLIGVWNVFTFLLVHSLGKYNLIIEWHICNSSVRTFQARALGAFHGRVSSTARAWGHKFSSEAMHVYMGENRFSLWSYHIGTVFKSIQPSFDIYRVSNHHLVHDIHQMIGGLHNLYKFQWAITSCFSYVKYWPENIKTCLPPCGG